MKFIKFLFFAIASIIASFSLVSSTQSAFASTNDFYFKDATFDYYINSTNSGTTMHVKEVLTAVFSEADQNHGITRAIPFSNVGGKNITVKDPQSLNLQVTRNGVSEPVSKIEKDKDEYIVYIGSASEYVHGEQTYTLEYDFQNVITEFSASGENLTGKQSSNIAFQELYWDTNGTGWSQKFDHLKANLHLNTEQSKAIIGDKVSCYVGYYGNSNTSRCNITSDDETTYNPLSQNSSSSIATDANTSETIISFEASNLSPRENLTFAVDFKPGTFTVPELTKNFTLVIITIITSIICALIITILVIVYFKKAHQKCKYYKALFAAPQYAPLKDLDAAESSIICLKNTKNPYVATLLELAVAGKITIVKGEPTKVLKKDTWAIQLNDIKNLTNSQFDLLKLLAGGTDPDKIDGNIIKVEKHRPTAALEAISKDYQKDAKNSLKTHGYLEESATKAKGLPAFGVLITSMLIIACFSFGPRILRLFTGPNFNLEYGDVIGKEFLPFAIPAIAIITLIVAITLGSLIVKFKKFTEKGLDAANYLDGLHLYIKMAEADRIKFLQSVKGADTSASGIVKLYEKLLPYACLFGLEESWLDAFGKYCKEIDYSPTWYGGDDFITFYALSSMTRHLNSTISSSTAYSSSNSGSSSFSAGGGGGGGGW